ncbi:hypothetical protein [Streptomyces sp. NPDC018031]|uniref:hypothetical protein n=1 Tax=Streptomyces sp. NPDC018031 TaxID=3365033 RepID=UPI0037AE4596
MSSKKSTSAKQAAARSADQGKPGKTSKPGGSGSAGGATRRPGTTAGAKKGGSPGRPGGRADGAAGKAAKSAAAAPAPAEPSGPRPARIAAAAALTALEGAVLLGFGVYLLVMGLIGDPDSPRQAEMLAVTVLALALLPVAAARGLWLRRSWSRGPAMITQLMALPVAWTLVQNGGGLIAIGVAVAAVSFAVLGLLVNPTATQALGIGPRDA